MPVDLAGDWRIVPDDAGRPSECISLRADSVVFYTVACDGVNDPVSAEPVIVDRSTVFIDLTAVDRDGIPGRIQILGILIDADTIDGQLRILGGVLDQPLEVIEVTLIR